MIANRAPRAATPNNSCKLTATPGRRRARLSATWGTRLIGKYRRRACRAIPAAPLVARAATRKIVACATRVRPAIHFCGSMKQGALLGTLDAHRALTSTPKIGAEPAPSTAKFAPQPQIAYVVTSSLISRYSKTMAVSIAASSESRQFSRTAMGSA